MKTKILADFQICICVPLKNITIISLRKKIAQNRKGSNFYYPSFHGNVCRFTGVAVLKETISFHYNNYEAVKLSAHHVHFELQF